MMRRKLSGSRSIRRCTIALALALATLPGCSRWLARWVISEERLELAEPENAAHSFQTMSELFPTRTVARAGPVHAFERAPRPLGDVLYDLDGATRSIDDFLERSRTAGIVVLHDGRLVFERYGLGADAGTRFTSWSVAKSFTATLVGLALGEGLIESLDDPLVRYVPQLAGSAYDGVTIEQALQMSSGVAFSEVYDDESTDVIEFMGYTMLANRVPANEYMIRFPRAAEPGSVFNYSTGETQVLGWLVREVTGRPLAQYLSETVWSRIGMEHDASWILDREGAAGMEMAGCCLNAALRDYARFGQLMLQDGMWRTADGEPVRVLPEGWVRAATVPDSPQVDFGRLFPGSDQGYQYQWWALGGPDGAYSAEGVYGQFVYVNPAHRVVIAKASAWPVAWDEQHERETWAAFDAIVAELGRR